LTNGTNRREQKRPENLRRKDALLNRRNAADFAPGQEPPGWRLLRDWQGREDERKSAQDVTPSRTRASPLCGMAPQKKTPGFLGRGLLS
jgi:hypothetical protein